MVGIRSLLVGFVLAAVLPALAQAPQPEVVTSLLAQARRAEVNEPPAMAAMAQSDIAGAEERGQQYDLALVDQNAAFRLGLDIGLAGAASEADRASLMQAKEYAESSAIQFTMREEGLDAAIKLIVQSDINHAVMYDAIMIFLGMPPLGEGTRRTQVPTAVLARDVLAMVADAHAHDGGFPARAVGMVLRRQDLDPADRGEFERLTAAAGEASRQEVDGIATGEHAKAPRPVPAPPASSDPVYAELDRIEHLLFSNHAAASKALFALESSLTEDVVEAHPNFALDWAQYSHQLGDDADAAIMLDRGLARFESQAAALDGYFEDHGFADSLAKFNRRMPRIEGAYRLAATIDLGTAVTRAEKLQSNIARPFVLVAVAGSLAPAFKPPTHGVPYPPVAENLPPLPALQTLSIKANTDAGAGTSNNLAADPARLALSNISLAAAIARIYNLKPDELSGPAWMSTAHFDIVATYSNVQPSDEKNAVIDQQLLLLQPAFATAFGLTSHLEDKSVPAFDLTVVKAGIKLKAAQGDTYSRITFNNGARQAAGLLRRSASNWGCNSRPARPRST